MSPHPSNQPDSAQPLTQAETPEDIRRALQTNKMAVPVATNLQHIPVAMPVKKDAADAGPKPALAAPFRPTIRPLICVLTVLDDGKPDGENIRVRGNRFVIGRTEGDLLIPHDELISGRHVEITRQLVGGQHRWVITDLQSTNGVFLRASRILLGDRSEFLVGKGRYRFEQPGPKIPETVDELPSNAVPAGTQAWGAAAPPGLHPALVELIGGGIGNRVALTKAEYWIGTDISCAISRVGDPFAEPQHVRLSRDAKGAWTATHNKSLNGLWYKVLQANVEDACMFQIGEQRFRIRVGG